MKNSVMTPRHDPYAAIRTKNCRQFLAGNIFSTVGAQMLYLALSWEVYQRTNSPTALGVVGLFQVMPIMLFSIPAGHLVDRLDRKRVVVIDQFLFGLSALLLWLVSFGRQNVPDAAVLSWANGVLNWVAGSLGETQQHFADAYVPAMLGVLFLNGIIRSVNQPAKQALLPQLVTTEMFPNAVTWHSSMVEVSTMVGPAVAGALLSGSVGEGSRGTGQAFPVVYGIAAVLQFLSVGYFARTQPAVRGGGREPLSVRAVGRGLAFVWRSKILFATVTMDLLGVLLGGSVVLLPMFAKDVLHCGPTGLGILRAAPSVGACTMALVLAHRPTMQRTGVWMLLAVVLFGAATIGFGLSRNIVLSLVMLVMIGACDNISTIGRQMLVQLLTPDAMRGRVSAVKAVFSSASDGLGALESGFTAAALGPRVAVVLGGLGTIAVAGLCSLIWPELRQFRADAASAELGELEEHAAAVQKSGEVFEGGGQMACAGLAK